jgi:hypothetical protein
MNLEIHHPRLFPLDLPCNVPAKGIVLLALLKRRIYKR